MGSLITLGVAKLEIDWGKNNICNDHSHLFLQEDIAEIPYYYTEDLVKYKPGLSRKLKSIKKRLDLLGYSLSKLKILYDESIDLVPDYYPPVIINFEQFKHIISSIDLDKISLESSFGDYDLGEFVSRYIFKENAVEKFLPRGVKVDRELGTFFENLDPYIILRLLAENPRNLEKSVEWRYADVADGGWIDENKIIKPIPIESKILIVTEGTTDSYILKKSLKILMPDIADFFYFVDMEENYPFTGTGNLYRFCQGLTSIQIQNKILIIFDNDAAGIESYNKTQRLSLPQNLKITTLPNHIDFENFKTIGPSGESMENINGSAVAIECFLDLTTVKNSRMRWTSYNSNLNCYQGEIENKSKLLKEFKKSNLDNNYDTSRLTFLLNHIIDFWVNG